VRPTSWLPLAVLALLVGLTFWLNQLVQPSAARGDGSMRHDPDLIVEKFNARTLGVDGNVLYTLAADRMVHYPDDDSAHLLAVRLEAFEPTQPKLSATADRGRLEQGGDRVLVEGNVVVIREADAKLGRARITTEKLLLLPDAGIARTREPVLLESPEGRARAVGMELDNHARILRLERVKATYRPSPRRPEAAR
jgi:lipopolysaccharide export system protein LptC